MWERLFDRYNLRARLSPSLILLSPVLINIYLLIGSVRELATTIIVVVISLALSNLLILFSRYKGDKKIKNIISNEVMATRLLMPDDDNIDEITKKRYYKYFNENISDLELNIEINDRTILMKKCKTAIKWLKEKTRDKEKYALVFEENINIGFCKNIYGLKTLGIISTIGIIVIIIFYYLYFKKINIMELPVEAILSISIDFAYLIIWTSVVTKKLVIYIYKKYAKALLGACDI